MYNISETQMDGWMDGWMDDKPDILIQHSVRCSTQV